MKRLLMCLIVLLFCLTGDAGVLRERLKKFRARFAYVKIPRGFVTDAVTVVPDQAKCRKSGTV